MPELPEVELARRALDRWTRGATITALKLADPGVLRGGSGADSQLVGTTPWAWRRHGKLLAGWLSPDPRPELWTEPQDRGLGQGAKRLDAEAWPRHVEHPDVKPDAGHVHGPKPNPSLGGGVGLSSGAVLLAHLRMTGTWVAEPGPERRFVRATLCLAPPRGAGQPRAVAFVDQRRFGWLEVVTPRAARAAFAAMGPDALLQPLTGADLAARAGASRASLHAKLLDQRVLAGVGNIAASEIPWRARVHPHTPCRALAPGQWDAVAAAIRAHLVYALATDGPASEADHELVYMTAGGPNPFLCYGRAGEACLRCEAPLVRGRQGGRSTFWCPRCQLPPS